MTWTDSAHGLRGVKETRKPLREASTLPGGLYHDPDIYREELRRIFSKLWIVAGRAQEMPSPGCFLTCEVGNDAVFLVRNGEGRLQGHHNVCRHRGARLLSPVEGRLELIRCPYHGWTYGLDGRLLGAPLTDQIEGFSKADTPLLPVRVELWEGFAFVNLDSGAPPLARQLEGFPDFSRFRLGELVRKACKRYEVRANWKLLVENYGECYHCPVAHPQLNRVSDYRSGGRDRSGPGFTGGPMRLNEGCTTMSMTGVTTRKPIAHLPAGDHREVHYYHLYPNFLLSLHPDYVMTHTVWPTGATSSRVLCEFLFPLEAVVEEGFDPSDAVEFWDLTNRQDWELCELAQKGVQSSAYRPGRYQIGEVNVHAFDNWYLDLMGLEAQ